MIPPPYSQQGYDTYPKVYNAVLYPDSCKSCCSTWYVIISTRYKNSWPRLDIGPVCSIEVLLRTGSPFGLRLVWKPLAVAWVFLNRLSSFLSYSSSFQLVFPELPKRADGLQWNPLVHNLMAVCMAQQIRLYDVNSTEKLWGELSVLSPNTI